MPNKIRFTSGQHKGRVFERGKGPAERISIGGGINFLRNSKNFWYNGPNETLSADYLDKHRKEWIEES